jgi:uncharacterized protein (TIGR00251 family)
MFTIQVRVSPRSSREGITGKIGERYKISVHEAPEKGKANKRVKRILSELFGVPVQSIEVVTGQAQRDKKILVKGISEDKARACVDAAASGSHA